MSAQVRSGCSLDLSLAGDNDHDVIGIANLEVLHAQLELIASLDGSAVLVADLDIAAVDSLSGVDFTVRANQRLSDVLSLNSLIHILGRKVGNPDIGVAEFVILGQLSLDVSLQSGLNLQSAAIVLSNLGCLVCQIVIDCLDGSLVSSPFTVEKFSEISFSIAFT